MIRQEDDRTCLDRAVSRAYTRAPERVSTGTACEYRRIARQLATRRSWPEDAAQHRSTYVKYVAALTFLAAKIVLDDVRAAVEPGQALDAETRALLLWADHLLARYPPGIPGDPGAFHQTATDHGSDLPRRSHGRRATARRYARSERASNGNLLAAAWDDGRAPDAVALATLGPIRGSEIARGVTVTRLPRALRFYVLGTKTDAERGQPHRSFEIPLGYPATDQLARLVPELDDSVQIRCPTRTLYRAFTMAAQEGLGRRLGRDITPQTCRHVYTARARVHKDPVTTAAVRGDTSTVSAKRYGGGGGRGPLAGNVVTCRSVRRSPRVGVTPAIAIGAAAPAGPIAQLRKP
jgi:hypothetical protein